MPSVQGSSVAGRQRGLPAVIPTPQPLGAALLGRLRRDAFAFASLLFILALIALCIFGPEAYKELAPRELQQYHTYNFQDFKNINTGPGSVYQDATGTVYHWLGADALGRDTLARLLLGLRVSFLVAAFVQVINIGLGAGLGLLAGTFGGWIDMVVSRIADMLFAFPGLLLAILVSAIFGPGAQAAAGDVGRLLLVSAALALVSWPLMARYVRSQTLTLKERDFVLAARSMGVGEGGLMFYHLLPNVAGLIITAATLDIASVILNEAVLSLLGLGVQSPTSSLGLMITLAIPYLRNNAFQVFVPAATLTLLVLAFSFLGDGLRDALDPNSR
jgi:peptide/nickel transport system permease protein